ncbi:MAG: hypothetical protein J6J71_04715 [Prevotella sp.]|nr:hypothetical protein [Prevotella sp.]
MKKKELEEVLVDLTKRVNEMQCDLAVAKEVIDFITNHNKDEVVYENGCLKWLYDGEIKRLMLGENEEYFDVVENNSRYSVIRILKSFMFYQYHKLDKANGILMNVSDIYKSKEKEQGETQANSEPTEQKCECKFKKRG